MSNSFNNGKSITTGFYIPVDWFLRVSGLHDKRNNMSAIKQHINMYPRRYEGYLWYHDAIRIADTLYATGEYWMYDDFAVRFLDFFDDMIANGNVNVIYK